MTVFIKSTLDVIYSGAKIRAICITAVLAVFFFVANNLYANDIPPNPQAKAGWTLEDHDEFDGPLLDRWQSFEEYDMFYEFRADNDASVLVLKIPVNAPIHTYERQMTANGMTNKTRFSPSTTDTLYFEERSKHPIGRTGSHAAWWNWATGWDEGAEIDIYEDDEWGGPNIHIDGVCSIDKNIPNGPQTWNFYNVYGFEVSPTGFRIFFNDSIISDCKIDWKALHYPSWYQIFSMYDYTLKRDIQHEYVIDYWRMYRKGPSTNTSPIIQRKDHFQGLSVVHNGTFVNVHTDATATVRITDSQGRLVRQVTGSGSITIDTRNLAIGAYIISAHQQDNRLTKQVMIAR